MKRSWLALFVLSAALLAGCNGSARRDPAPKKHVVKRDPALEAGLRTLSQPQGLQHTLVKGETLYSLSRKYKVPVAALVAANPGLDPRKMRVGSRITIPGVAKPGSKPGTTATRLVGPKPPRSSTPDRGRLRYPVTSKYRAVGGGTPGAEFGVKTGTTVVAAAKGKVVLATGDLGGLGPTVMVDHGGGLVTMYGRLADYAVRPGQNVKRGESIGRSGSLGLLFRVYQGAVPRSPGAYIK